MVIVVSQGQSIQTAVNAALPRDTVLVRSGVYNESVTIPAGKDRIRIIGSGVSKTILDGTGLGNVDGFEIAASSFVTIAGFTVRNFGLHGVQINTNDNVVRDNELRNNGMGGGSGVDIQGSRNLVKDNHMTENIDDGIHLFTGTHNFLISNTITMNGGDGIDIFEEAPHTLVLGNEISGSRDEGIMIVADGCWVIGNRSNDNGSDGIDIENCENVLVYDNTCTGNRQAGLEVDSVGLIALRNKLLRNGTDGFTVGIDETEATLGLQQSILYANEMSYNPEDGFQGTPSTTFNLFLENDVDENGDDGIDLDGGDFNRLLANDMDDNQGRGIDVDEDSDNNVIDDNRVDDNHGSGIRLDPEADLNAVRTNKLSGNRPFDILAEPPADVDNTFDLNQCDNSSPSGLCG